MPDLLSRVLGLVAGLHERGWSETLGPHGIDLSTVESGDALTEARSEIDRKRPGYQDFSSSGRALITPGDPALSLLYHALASPGVHPDAQNRPRGQGKYATLDELDLLENYIYALKPPKEADLRTLVPVVVAYTYRTAARTTHRAHADLVFSRTGVARTGTKPPRYDRARRCFDPDDRAPDEVRVMPARYGLFLARAEDADPGRRKSWRFAATTRRRPKKRHTYLVPVHKLFPGPECLPGRTLGISFSDWHINEKLARAFKVSRGLDKKPGQDLSRPPFTIVSRDGQTGTSVPPVVATRPTGASITVSPPHRPLIETAQQDGATVTVDVPGEHWLISRLNRRYTSLRLSDGLGDLIEEAIDNIIDISDFPRPRNGPEFVNIRHRLGAAGIEDMLEQPANPGTYEELVEDGDYEAVLFLDHCGEGAISARIDGGTGLKPVKPAYSIVAAPDFFPFANQLQLSRWFGETGIREAEIFNEGGAPPLCYGRLPVNPQILDPGTERAAFPRDERTVVALVSAKARGRKVGKRAASPERLTSFLTDAASNVFAPGWDVTYAGDDVGVFYATYGLGSPFPEDVKLCAAANSFWPAVSPDASRTFGRDDTPTAIPLLDAELGRHPQHPLSRKDAAMAARGWDGEYGPFVTPDGLRVNYADIERSDYVANLLHGRWRFDLLSAVGHRELTARIAAMRRAVMALEDRTPAKSERWLVSAAAVADWAADPLHTAFTDLKGAGYRFLFAEVRESPEKAAHTDEPARVERRLKGKVALCLVDGDRVRVKQAKPGPGVLALYA